MYRFLFFLASLSLTATAWSQPVTFGASVQLTGPVANTGAITRTPTNLRWRGSTRRRYQDWLRAQQDRAENLDNQSTST